MTTEAGKPLLKFQETKVKGTERNVCESKMLSLMLGGFSHINVDNTSFDTFQMFQQNCNLSQYAKAINAEEAEGYSTLTEEARLYFHNMAVLDALVMRGLVDREILFVVNDDWEEYCDLNGKLDKTDAWSLAWKATATSCTDEKCKKIYQRDDRGEASLELINISYRLNSKGYDIALKLQEHLDQENRFSNQISLAETAKNISTQSLESAVASRKIAQGALLVAIIIAITSVFNLFIKYGESNAGNAGIFETVHNALNTRIAGLEKESKEAYKLIGTINTKFTKLERTVESSQTRVGPAVQGDLSVKVVEVNRRAVATITDGAGFLPQGLSRWSIL